MGLEAMGPTRTPRRALALLLLGTASAAFAAASPEARFLEANELARRGDYPKAIAVYDELARSGLVSASLYWNWAQAARALGARGEALFALLRARELEPGERSITRAIEETRAEANLDPAELAPEPLAGLARLARRFRLDALATALLLASLLAHAAAVFGQKARGRTAALWIAALALAVGVLPVLGSLARGTAVVVRRGAPLLEAASATAEPTGTLREGEVVPVLGQSPGYLRVEDSSGARGWARVLDVRRLDGPLEGEAR